MIIARSVSNQKYFTPNVYQPISNYFHNDKKNTESFERVIFISDEEKRVLMEEYHQQ